MTTTAPLVQTQSGPMSLDDFVRIFSLPPIVPPKRCQEIFACGHSKLYGLRQEGKIRIVPRPGGGTGVPVEDVYKLCIAAVSP